MKRRPERFNMGRGALSSDAISIIRLSPEELHRALKILEQYCNIMGHSGYELFLKKEAFLHGYMASRLDNLGNVDD